MKNQNREIQELEEKASNLEQQIRKQKSDNLKHLNIRNLKIFGSTCKLIAPYIITAGITIGTFNIFGDGLPFHKDNITKYKVYNLDYKSSGYVYMDNSYEKYSLLDEQLPKNKLIIYTPWEYKDNLLTRYKREYNIDEINIQNLFDAVLDENYSYIEENLKDYKEEVQTISNISEFNKDDYVFDVSLHIRDKKDILKYSEENLKNMVITIVEIILNLGVGVIISRNRNFNYSLSIEKINSDYNDNIQEIEPIIKELEITNSKILSLTRKREDTNE